MEGRKRETEGQSCHFKHREAIGDLKTNWKCLLWAMHIFLSARLWLSWRYKGLLNIWKGPRWVPMKRQTHRQPRGVSGKTPCFLILQNDLQVCEIINDFNFADDPSGGKKIRRLRENIWKILDLLYKTDSKRNLLLKKIHGKWCQDTKNNNKKICVITQQQPKRVWDRP